MVWLSSHNLPCLPFKKGEYLILIFRKKRKVARDSEWVNGVDSEKKGKKEEKMKENEG